MRELIDSLDRQFADLNVRSCELISGISEKLLYLHPNENASISVGVLVVRSAGAVEQMIGGITTRLWDDPFEWTLPEHLSRADDVLNYLAEVEAGRRGGFAFFRNDEELEKLLPAPVEMKTLHEVLRQTLLRAESLYDQALALQESLESNKTSS
jgi:hypothetical protein